MCGLRSRGQGLGLEKKKYLYTYTEATLEAERVAGFRSHVCLSLSDHLGIKLLVQQRPQLLSDANCVLTSGAVVENSGAPGQGGRDGGRESEWLWQGKGFRWSTKGAE